MHTAYKPYAEALFSLVTEEKESDLTQVFDDLNGIAGIFKAEPDFMKLTDNTLGFGKKLIWNRE